MFRNKNTLIVLTVFAALLLFGATAHAGQRLSKTQGLILDATDSYLVIKATLASDSTRGLRAEAKNLNKKSKKLLAIAQASGNKRLEKYMKYVYTTSKELSKKKISIKEVRSIFKPLSFYMALTVNAYLPDGVPKGVRFFYDDRNDAYWMQTGKKLANPYFGGSRSDYGEQVFFE